MTELSLQLSGNSQHVLQTLSVETGKSIPELLEAAVEELRRKVFFEGLNYDFQSLKADPHAWADELEERRLSENTLMDGIAPDDTYPGSAPPED